MDATVRGRDVNREERRRQERFEKSHVLMCPECGWVPEDSTTIGVVTAHMETEHGIVSDNINLVLRKKRS